MSKDDREVRRSPVLAALMAMSLAFTLTAGGCDTGPGPGPGPGPPGQPEKLTFGVWGTEQEIAAYQAVVDSYNARSSESEVELASWPTPDALVEELRSGGEFPDIFMASRHDLAWLQKDELTVPLLELLDERGVEFGDGYSRDALLAFSADSQLQCMPYGISPMVIYYNTELVDFERMRLAGLPAPAEPVEESEPESWSFVEFASAADFATRPRLRSRGVHIDATLSGLSPFIYSGGGSVFDDQTEPTSLAFSEGDSRGALTTTLELLRDPQLTLTEEQLSRASPIEWFERGQLGMIAGDRALTPRLRRISSLSFDVMPIPVIEDQATIGDITGLCVATEATSVAEAADFLVHAISTESVARVVRAGYLVPANIAVALTADFLQPGRQPLHSRVFNASIAELRIQPLIADWKALEAAVADDIEQLVTDPGFLDLEGTTARIDEASRSVLDPDSNAAAPQR